jgi:hypothetical protein
MKTMRFALPLVLLACALPLPAFADGTLAINVAPFTSEVKLKDKIRKQLEGGGMEWGYANNRLVVTSVNKQFVGPVIDHLTRFGTNASLTLPAGDYQISCVGMLYDGGLSVEKVLSKGAFFNENVLAFHIVDGKVTTLDIKPTIRASSGFFLKLFMPEYLATVTSDGAVTQQVSLNSRTEKSVSWDDYHGDLKFKK